jgi:phospholipid transport system substrate-binding protein
MLKQIRQMLGLTLVVMLWTVTSAQASWDDASAVVHGATLQMQQLLSDKTLSNASEFQRLYDGVDLLLSPVVDFNRISRGVMAKYYRQATAEQRQRFSEVFKGTLIKTYSKALTVFDIASFKLVPNPSPSRKKGREFVRVDITSSDSKHYLLDYYMVQGKQGWQLVNVRVDGINLGQVFKRQFAEALDRNKGDIDRVIELWRAMSKVSSDSVSSGPVSSGSVSSDQSS